MADTLTNFFGVVGKHNLLTREDEARLAQAIEAGDKRARDKMIASNLRLAISIAKRYMNKGCSFEDLIQESNVGLIKAVDRFDYRRGLQVLHLRNLVDSTVYSTSCHRPVLQHPDARFCKCVLLSCEDDDSGLHY